MMRVHFSRLIRGRKKRHAPLLALALLALAGCQTPVAFQEWAQGRPLTDLESCMGVPDHEAHQGALSFAEWSAKRATGNITVPMSDLALLPITWPISLATAGSVSMPSSGDCTVVATSGADGRVQRVAYTGDRNGWRGRNTVCLPVIDGCLEPAPHPAAPASAAPAEDAEQQLR